MSEEITSAQMNERVKRFRKWRDGLFLVQLALFAGSAVLLGFQSFTFALNLFCAAFVFVRIGEYFHTRIMETFRAREMSVSEEGLRDSQAFRA